MDEREESVSKRGNGFLEFFCRVFLKYGMTIAIESFLISLISSRLLKKIESKHGKEDSSNRICANSMEDSRVSRLKYKYLKWNVESSWKAEVQKFKR